MSLIGPLVTEIRNVICFIIQNPWLHSSSLIHEGVWRWQSLPMRLHVVAYRTWASRYIDVRYLRHQWSDAAHTLQFDSTDEYFETVEYEPRSPLELRDSSRKPLILLDLTPHIQVYSSSRTAGNMISRSTIFFLYFLNIPLGSEVPPGEILWFGTVFRRKSNIIDFRIK